MKAFIEWIDVLWLGVLRLLILNGRFQMKKSFIKLLTIMLFASAPLAHVYAMEELPAQEAQEKNANPMLQDPFLVAIMEATKKNSLEALRELLRTGADANRIFEFPDHGRVPAILFVISLFDVNKNSKSIKDTVNLLIEHGADVNVIDHMGQTPLMLAAYVGSVDIAMLLILHGAAKGIDTKAAGHHGQSALAMAAEAGHLNVVELLIKLGAQIDIQNDRGITPLMGASAAGYLKVVQHLVQRGASIGMQAAGVDNCSALSVAAQFGRTNVVEFLLNAGASVDMQDAHGATALMLASQNGHLDIVHLLLRHKAAADIQAAGNQNATALIFAANNGHSHAVQALLQADAQIDLANAQGITPLMFAAHTGGKEVGELLLKNGAKVNAQAAGIENRTALQLAVETNHVEIAELLIAQGADVNLALVNGRTSLMLAAAAQKIDLLKLLLQHNATVDAQAAGMSNSSALMCAALNGKEHSVCTLLDANADISLRDTDNNTALCLGAQNCRFSVVNQFLSYLPRQTNESIRNCFTGLLALHRLHLVYDEHGDATITCESANGYRLPLDIRRLLTQHVVRSFMDEPMQRNEQHVALRNNNNQTAGEVAASAAVRAELAGLEDDVKKTWTEECNSIAHLLDVNNPESRLERRKLVWNEIAGILLDNPESEAGSEEVQGSEKELGSGDELNFENK